MNLLWSLVVIAIAVLLLILLMRRQQRVSRATLRPLPGYATLKAQVGRAIESGSQLHITLGQASLIGPGSTTSVAALNVLDHLAKDGCANGTPPVVTVGEGTLLPVAQTSLRHAYVAAGRPSEFQPEAAQFLAADSDPFAYAGGVAGLIHRGRFASNVMVGRFGAELAIMTEAAAQQNVEQIVGSDDPAALAVATAVTDNVLIGEELLAAGAYLDGRPSQIASLEVQDIFRWLISAAILLVALVEIIL